MISPNTRDQSNISPLVFVLSAANSDLYIGSRTLYGLAVEGNAPRIFKRVNRLGVPWPALTLCTAFCFLVYLNVSSSSQRGEICSHFYVRVLIVYSIWLVRQSGFDLWRHYLDVHCMDSHVSFCFVYLSDF